MCISQMMWSSFCLLSLFVSLGSSQHTIQQALHMSQASYCPGVSLASWECSTCDADAVLMDIVEQGGERALLGAYPKENIIFVSFRGSTNIQNWIDNVQFAQTCPYTSYPDVCVETGFYKVFNELYPSVNETLHYMAGVFGTRNVLITGHSLGAAVGTLTAYALRDQSLGEFDVSLITFGSPRVGNAAFSAAVSHSTRITHAYDIVPHVPQEFLGYLHTPHEVWYPGTEEEGSVECDDGDGNEDPNCSNSCGPLHCTSISDHLTYLDVNMGSDGDCE